MSTITNASQAINLYDSGSLVASKFSIDNSNASVETVISAQTKVKVSNPFALDANGGADAIDDAQAQINQNSAAAINAQTTADAAATAAGNAQTTADGAVTAAGNAQSTADGAVTAAGNAQSTADAAVTAAGNAQSAADAAQAAADAAQAAADAAAAAAAVADTLDEADLEKINTLLNAENSSTLQELLTQVNALQATVDGLTAPPAT